MNVGWVSAPLSASTGYGVVSKNVCLRLADMGYNVFNIGGRGTTIVWGEKYYVVSPKGNTVLVLPSWGTTTVTPILEYYIRKYQIDVVVSLFDAFALGFRKPSKPWAAYVPIDASITKKWYNYMIEADIVVGMSKFGENELLKWFPDVMVDYIPHGVDTSIFKPVSKNKRTRLRKMYNIPLDKFVVLFVGTNMGERKCIPQLMIAFKRFIEKHPDSILYIFANLNESYPQGYDLISFAEELKISDHIMGPTFNPVLDSVDDQYLANLYACADVFILPSMGEGFGLPLIEACSSGIPPIGTRTSSIIELVEGHGWLIDTVPDEEWIDVPVWVPLLAQYRVPSIKGIVEKLCEAYNNPSLREEYGVKAREFALQYDWENIMPKWDSLLKKLSSIIL